MPRISNKTVQYRLKATNERDQLVLIDDDASITLPSIEKLTDTIKGAGIMGEIDFPAYGQIGSLTMAINFRADNPMYAVLSRPGAIRFEIVWVIDIFDSNNVKVGLQQHKAFAVGLNKTYNAGTLDVNASADGSNEFELLSWRKVVDGREILLVDKLNYKYVVNGVDYMQQLRSALQ